MKDKSLAIIKPALSQKGYAKLNKAKDLCRTFGNLEVSFLRTGRDMMHYGCHIGALLLELKEEIGHGKWTIWLCANFKELGHNEITICRNAQRFMNLSKANPNITNSTVLDPESERKFMWGYVPVK